MVYPKPRYSRPFMMDPANYEWLPADGAPGVAEKFLGSFTERRSTARMVRLDPGASFEAQGRSLYFVIDGQGTVGTEVLQRFTTTYLAKGERVRFTAAAPTEMLHLGLPDLSALASGRSDMTAVAAE
jgi:hypothetical protein